MITKHLFYRWTTPAYLKIYILVRPAGLEPARLSAEDFKSSMSAIPSQPHRLYFDLEQETGLEPAISDLASQRHNQLDHSHIIN